MASKTALPIARLRSLGCKVGTIIGHDVPSPVSGRNPSIRATWKYGITLPDDLELPEGAATRNGRSVVARVAEDGRIIVSGFDAGGSIVTTRSVNLAKIDRQETEAQVAGLLNSIADALSKA